MPPRFDFRGFLMVGAGLALLQYGIENIGPADHPAACHRRPSLIAAVLFLLAFLRHARKVAAPAVDLTLVSPAQLSASGRSPAACAASG